MDLAKLGIRAEDVFPADFLSNMASEKIAEAVKDMDGLKVAQTAILREMAQRATETHNGTHGDPSDAEAMLKVYAGASKVSRENIAAVEKHKAAVVKGAEIERKKGVDALGEYIHNDGQKYMEMNTEFNPRLFMALKELDPSAVGKMLEYLISKQKGKDPKLAGRMEQWDKEKGNKN